MDFMDHTLDMPEKKIAPWLKVMKVFSCGGFVCLLCWGLYPVPLYAEQTWSGELHSFINFVKCFSTGQLNDLALENRLQRFILSSTCGHTHSLTFLVHFIFFLSSVCEYPVLVLDEKSLSWNFLAIFAGNGCQ